MYFAFYKKKMAIEVESPQKAPGCRFKEFRYGLFPALLFGRIIGAVPYSFSNLFGLARDERVNLQFRWLSWPSFFTTCMTIMSVLNLIMIIWEVVVTMNFQKDNTSAGSLLLNCLTLAFPLAFVYIYGFFLYNRDKFPKLIKNFEKTSASISKCSASKDNKSFPKLCGAIVIFLAVVSIFENAMFDLQRFKRKDLQLEDKPILYKYYIHNGRFLQYILPYHPLLAIILFITHKFSSYVGTFVDILVIIFCYALTKQYQGVSSYIAIRLRDLNDLKDVKMPAKDIISWDNIRTEILGLYDLTEELSGFISPLLICSWSVNLLCWSVQIFSWLHPYAFNDSVEASIYMTITNFTFALRIFLLTYFTANVHHAGKDIAKVMHICPYNYFDNSAERLERLIENDPPGIRLMSTFLISRSMFVSIVSLICTSEIILMQSDGIHRYFTY